LAKEGVGKGWQRFWAKGWQRLAKVVHDHTPTKAKG
jgi:hypothetical protein